MDNASPQILSVARSAADSRIASPPPGGPHRREGDRCHDYVLTKLIGVGGFGEVWLGRRPDSAEGEVALKFPLVDSQHSLAILQREAANSARLSRAIDRNGGPTPPPIVPILRDLTRQDPPMLVMPYIRGGDLRSHVERRDADNRAMTVAESLPIIRDVLDALSFAHRHDIVHRDLSPENILYDPDCDRWMVCDFGLGGRTIEAETTRALSFDRSLATRTRLTTLRAGKFRYMSPEQCRGESKIGPGADFYALGVIWAQLLQGDLDSGLPAMWAETMPIAIRKVLRVLLHEHPSERELTRRALESAVQRVPGFARRQVPYMRPQYPSPWSIPIVLGVVCAGSLVLGFYPATFLTFVMCSVASLFAMADTSGQMKSFRLSPAQQYAPGVVLGLWLFPVFSLVAAVVFQFLITLWRG